MIGEHWIPLLALGFGWMLLTPEASGRRWVRAAPLAFAAAFVGKYLHWRLMDTVLPAEGWTAHAIFIWTVFLLEAISWASAGILFLQLGRRTDRSADADGHEARLRATAPWALPVVDVLVCTYDEDRSVLERTVLGALALDWPRDRLRVHVLDDGRREWLQDWCAPRGAAWVTRPDNRHAKAGNLDHAFGLTSGEFILVLDADFVPRRDMLYRMMGFFQEPGIGIVQAPHSFFNYDPMQANLGLRGAMPNDQRFFFGDVMPGRDGWDCAFCCGSNGIIRRAALEDCGGAMPTECVTEDMLLTLVMLRRGWITRYLNERLAVGLAPESLAAFFVQRARWARGAMQMVFLRDGPLGPGLTPLQRLMFLPIHWPSQTIGRILSLGLPACYLLTGVLPMTSVSFEDVVGVQPPRLPRVPARLGQRPQIVRPVVRPQCDRCFHGDPP